MPNDKSANLLSNHLLGIDGGVDAASEHFGFGRNPVTNQSTGPRIIHTTVNPNGVVSAPAGSIALSDNGAVYSNNSSPSPGTSWTAAAGLAAYGCVSATSTNVVAADGNVAFNNTAGPSANITQGVSGFTAIEAGVYEYQFQVRGNPGVAADFIALAFGLSVNLAVPTPDRLFASSRDNTAAFPALGTLAVNGAGFVTLAIGDTVTLRNRTESGSNSVQLTSIPDGGEATTNAFLSLKKIS